MTDNGMAKRIGCSVEKARQLRVAIMGSWPQLADWMKAQIRYARRHGYCWTWWDGKRARCRPLPGIRSSDSRQRSRAENAALNTPVQGTASDFMLASICSIVEWIKRESVDAKAILTVHDSVVMEVRDQIIEPVVEKVIEIMLSHNSMDVPLKVDVVVGQNMGDTEEMVFDGA